MLSQAEIEEFQTCLQSWFHRNKRDLPWRRTRDPYAIWISEIMLQQTRVTAAIPYYLRFLERFPDLETLARAPESELLAHWAGLGYYGRARNLQKAAQTICAGNDSCPDASSSPLPQTCFPQSYGEILKLPGVGDYTAAAVASIAFDQAHAALDGNVYRVLSRLLTDETDIASSKAKKHFGEIAAQLLDNERPGIFNEAMMELGATICLPKNPQCLLCPVAAWCEARRATRQEEFPFKTVAKRKVRVHREIFWIEESGRLLAWQRPAESRLMPGFWELPERTQLPDAQPGELLGTFRHGITFHDYRFEVVRTEAPVDVGSCVWLKIEEIASLPASTIFAKAVKAVEQCRIGRTRIRKASAGRVD